MAKPIVLTQLAIEDYETIINYLEANWGPKVTNDFIDRFDQFLILLAENTSIYAFVDSVKRMQRCVLTKHNILYFIESDEIVKIITIFDTRQDPQKLTKII